MQGLEAFGVDVSKLADQRGGYPAAVPGRIAEIDGDFTSYQCAAVTRAELSGDAPMRDLEERCRATHNASEHIRKLAGAVAANVHITPSGSDKGGRDGHALQQPYQGNREGRERPEHLDAVRYYMEQMGAAAHVHQEADDGLAQAAYADVHNVVVCSSDKDLWGVPGWNLDPAKGSESLNWSDPSSIGRVEARDKDGKLIGRGWLYFFAQTLIGDSADHIKGLPCISNRMKQRLFPTKGFIALRDKECKTGKQQAARQAKLGAMLEGKSLFGPRSAVELLSRFNEQPASCAKDVFAVVKQLWEDAGTVHEFTDYRDGSPISPTQALLSDMRLLWMRRTVDDDVLKFIKEIHA